MVAREIVVIKKPRNDRIEDKPIAFPPLQNLHLSLMENKKKLKKGLPLVQMRTVPGKQEKLDIEPYTSDMLAGTKPVNIIRKSGHKKKDVEKKEHKKKEKKSSKKSKKDDIAEELEVDDGGEDDEEDEIEIDEDIEDDIADDVADDVADDDDDDGETDGHESAGEEDGEYAGLSPEEREAKEKEEYIWRFKIMKKKYPNKGIPEYNEHDDLQTMKVSYDRKLKEISLDENVDSYRTYLIIGFHAMEFVCTQWLNIDLKGFTAQQMAAMDKYDTLLIELGEKSRSRWFSSLPVEVRLIGFILLQAGLFYLGKVIAGNAGESIASFFSTITGQKQGTAGAASSETAPGPKKMRGPSINVENMKKNV